MTHCVAANSFAIVTIIIKIGLADKRRIRRPTGSAAAKISEKNSSLRNVTRTSSSSSLVKRAQDRSDLASAPSTNRFNVRARKRPGALAASASTDVQVSPSKESSKKDKDGYKIVCYYTNWSQYRVKLGKFLPEDIPADLCTHIIFAFGWLKKGRLSSFESNDETKDGKVGLYSRIIGLKKTNPSLKVRSFEPSHVDSQFQFCAISDSAGHWRLVVRNAEVQGNVRNAIRETNLHLLGDSLLETAWI